MLIFEAGFDVESEGDGLEQVARTEFIILFQVVE
jgi:hypothetical protein